MIKVKRILAPVDFSKASRAALHSACELARLFGAELDVLYVIPAIPTLPADMNYTFPIPEYEKSLRDMADEKLSELIAAECSGDVATRQLVSHGDPASEIVRVASEEGADWIVISTHGLTGWRHLVFGSVAEKVVRLADRPVHVISSRHIEAGAER